jgi:hypothetical protein
MFPPPGILVYPKKFPLWTRLRKILSLNLDPNALSILLEATWRAQFWIENKLSDMIGQFYSEKHWKIGDVTEKMTPSSKSKTASLCYQQLFVSFLIITSFTNILSSVESRKHRTYISKFSLRHPKKSTSQLSIKTVVRHHPHARPALSLFDNIVATRGGSVVDTVKNENLSLLQSGHVLFSNRPYLSLVLSVGNPIVYERCAFQHYHCIITNS